MRLTNLLCFVLFIGLVPMSLAQAPEAKPAEVKQEKPTKHPLDPLSEDEIKLTSKLLTDEKKATRRSLYSYIGLSEPKKEDVLVYKMGDKFERRAKAIFYDTATNTTTEAIVNLTDKKVESTKSVGRQGQWNPDDNKLAERILRTDPQWQAAVKKRKLDPIDVAIFAMPNRGYVDVKPDGSRYVLAGTFIDDRVDGAQIDDLLALVNVTKRKVEWVRDGGGKVIRADTTLTPENPALMEETRPAPKPLKITQPDGATFTMEGQEVRWQNWRFRIGTDPRIGLVLYTVGYEDEKKTRSVMYRASLSELFVPYGDPNYRMVHWFDAGEFGMETMFSSSFVPMNDAPENAKFLNVIVNDDQGRPQTVPNGIAIYEIDGGILWRHGGQSRRARDLVVACIHQAGNYDYCFKWIFHQDGSIDQQTDLSGFMETRNVDRLVEPDSGHAVAKGMVGTLVAPNIEATNHQHYFSFRLDMDVDGSVKNELYEMNVEPAASGDNKLKNAIVVRDTLLKTEESAQRSVNAATARSWKIVNPGVRNKYNQPAGYMLMPGETAVPYNLPDSFLRKISGFTNHHLWATPYDPAQLFAAGDYVFDGAPDDGLPAWTSKNRVIEFSDLVLYYTVGVTHIPRIEEWPIMSSHHAGFKLMPVGFFSSNPAMGVPRNK